LEVELFEDGFAIVRGADSSENDSLVRYSVFLLYQERKVEVAARCLFFLIPIHHFLII
jgi:hypothetical protein